MRLPLQLTSPPLLLLLLVTSSAITAAAQEGRSSAPLPPGAATPRPEGDPILYEGPHFYRDCPRECYCPPSFSTALNCEGRRLRSVPEVPSRAMHLYLQHNFIRTLRAGPFANASELRWVNLNDNRVASVEADALGGLKHLLHLYLERNALAEVPRGLPGSLQQLRLAYNRIATVPAESLSGLSHLLLLDLTGNSLADGSLTGETFKGLSNLVQLNLHGNRLTKMPEKLPTSLYQLFLEGNLISSVPKGYFGGFGRLFSIRLSFNKLTDEGLPATIFNISTLVELALGHNRLSKIPEIPPQLEHLYLNHNRIKNLDVASLCPAPAPSAPRRLRYLRLDENEIERAHPAEIMVCLPLLNALVV